MSITINHAVTLRLEDRCPRCEIHYCDLLHQKRELLIFKCGHVLDHTCVQQLTLKGRNVCPKCRSALKEHEKLILNLWGDCPFQHPLHTAHSLCDREAFSEEIVQGKIPCSIQDSLIFEMQLIITNCGHMMHAICWMEIEYKGDLGFCPECKQKITHVEIFRIRPVVYESLKFQQTEKIVDAFLQEAAPEKSRQKAASQAEAILDGFEFV